jgi:hypothetical protein
MEGTFRPHDSQYPSALIRAGSAELSAEQTGHSGAAVVAPELTAAGATGVPQVSQKPSASSNGWPQEGQLYVMSTSSA